MAKRRIKVDSEGRVSIPSDLARKYGIKPGRELFLEEGQDRFLINSPVERLARIYVEPTSRCNLACSTCIRNSWNEEMGEMQPEIFARILATLDESDPVPELFFGGFGEPLSHPKILDMIREVKARGARVELISNGILLDAHVAETLVELKLDRLWISIDGASPESYEDVRLGNELPLIIENLHRLRQIKYRYPGLLPRLGITFVAMERNIQDLSAVAKLTHDLGGDTLHVSNLLPHTDAKRADTLYQQRIDNWTNRGERVILPRMDANDRVWREYRELLRRYELHELTPNEFTKPKNSCPFVEKGSVSVRFDGQVGPCLPLLHTNTNYLKSLSRETQATFFGSLGESSLTEVWDDPEYVAFRKRVMEFDFSPCTSCASCELAEANREDCFGSEPISCGGCLWAQGFVQCP